MSLPSRDGGAAEEPGPRWLVVLGRFVSTTRLQNLVIGAVLGLLTWPVSAGFPPIDADMSWIVGLHIAAQQRLQFGHDIVFTFGPLGFVGYPQPYVGWTSGLALLLVASVHIAACASLFHLSRQALGAVRSIVFVALTAMFLWVIAGWLLYGVLIFVSAATAVLRHQERPTGIWFALGMGAAAAVATLGKLNVGAESLAISFIAVGVTARDWRRSLAVFWSSCGLAFLGLWLMLGQSLWDIPAYARAAYEISVGYSESMGLDDPATRWVSGVAVMAVVILAGLVWQRSSDASRRDRWGLWILFAIIVFVAYKGGFTRAGWGQVMFLVTVLALWPIVIPRVRSWVTASVPVAGMLIAVTAVSTMPLLQFIDPIASLKDFKHLAANAVLNGNDAAAATRAALRSHYDLSPEALAFLSGNTVDIQPWDNAVAYAYPEINWHPEPVFQAYSAYTPYLDQLNADSLAGDQAPGRILWLTTSALTIDGRDVWFDAPAAKIQMVCRYLPLAATSAWQVLGRVANRCGSPVTVATLMTVAGADVPVPADLPLGIVTVRIEGVGKDLPSKLVTLAFKAPPWLLTMGTTRSRLPLGTAGDPTIIGATTNVGYREALALAAPPDSINVSPGAGVPGFGSPLKIVFEVIPVAPTSG